MGNHSFEFLISLIFISSLMIFLLNFELNCNIPWLLHFLGQRSYVIYAAHTPIFFSLSHFTHRFRPEHSYIWLVIYVSITFIGVEIIYRLVEVPALKLSRSMSRRNPIG
jgi:hypothetical protein